MEVFMALREEWAGFKAGRLWQDEINVREFIQMNYTPYEGDSSFLAVLDRGNAEIVR